MLVASLVHSEEVQQLHRESKRAPIGRASFMKEETNGKEVTETVGAVANDQVPHDPKEGGDEDPEEVGEVFEELDPKFRPDNSTEDEDEDEKEESRPPYASYHRRRRILSKP